MVMELSVGRASQKSAAKSFEVLKPEKKWKIGSYLAVVGNYLLMMFYTTVCGWMLIYVKKMVMGEFDGATAKQIGTIFDNTLASPSSMIWSLGRALSSGMTMVSRSAQFHWPL